jgi:hypothetical protein
MHGNETYILDLWVKEDCPEHYLGIEFALKKETATLQI